MASLYQKRGVYYIAFTDAQGNRRQRSLQTSDKREAERMRKEIERHLAEGTAPSAGPLTLAEWAEKWLADRAIEGVRDVKNDATRLRKHVLPALGAMAIADIRAVDLRNLARQWRQAKAMAPKTVRNVYSTVSACFRDAQVDGLIAENPCILTEKHLGKNRDKNPLWRAQAIYTRAELEQIIIDERIPPDRRVLYAILALSAVRLGEACGLLWSSYDQRKQPFGALVIARSYDEERVKTEVPRMMPVHPVLARILAEWRMAGWIEMMGRPPKPDDPIVPLPPLREGKGRFNPRAGRIRSKEDCELRWQKDYVALEWPEPRRRIHDWRRTFISLAQDDGADRRVLEQFTHGGKGRNAIDSYTTLAWSTGCEHVAKLKIQYRQTGAEIVPLHADRQICPHCGQVMPAKEKTA